MGREQRVSKGMLVGAEVAPQSLAPFDFAWSKTDANSLSYGDGGTACAKIGLMEGVCVRVYVRVCTCGECGSGCGGIKGWCFFF